MMKEQEDVAGSRGEKCQARSGNEQCFRDHEFDAAHDEIRDKAND